MQKYNNTPKISELIRLRTDYHISFRLDIKSKMLRYYPLVCLAAERLYTWLKHYKKKPFIQSINTQNILVNNMLACIGKDKSLRADTILFIHKVNVNRDQYYFLIKCMFISKPHVLLLPPPIDFTQSPTIQFALHFSSEKNNLK